MVQKYFEYVVNVSSEAAVRKIQGIGSAWEYTAAKSQAAIARMNASAAGIGAGIGSMGTRTGAVVGGVTGSASAAVTRNIQQHNQALAQANQLQIKNNQALSSAGPLGVVAVRNINALTKGYTQFNNALAGLQKFQPMVRQTIDASTFRLNPPTFQGNA